MPLLILLLAAAPDAAVPSRAKAFVGARLIDGTDAAPTENATLIVRQGRIEAVGTKVAFLHSCGRGAECLPGDFGRGRPGRLRRTRTIESIWVAGNRVPGR